MKLPPAMKSDECRDAIVEYKRTGDVTHRNRAVRGCMRFVMRRARHYGRHGRNLDDLMQAGCEGLMRAFETYDPEKSAPLTHAVQWIDRFMIDHMKATQRMVPMPRAQGRVMTVMAAIADGDGTIDEVVETTRIARIAAGKPGSRGMHHDAVAGIMTLLAGKDVGDEFVPLEGAMPLADDALIDASRRRAVHAAIGTLTPAQRDAIKRVFWEEEPIAVMGRGRGVSRQRASQIVDAALEKMRKQLREVA